MPAYSEVLIIMIINIFLTAGLCLTAILGDFLVQKFENSHILKAVIDNGTHAAIGALTWGIVCFQRKVFPSSSEIIWQVLLCATVASLTDVDHFIEAKSLKLQDVHLLTNRPFMHCTTLAVGISFVFICLSYFYHWELLHSFGWIMFAAFISHHTRDATRRGYWVYPMGSTAPINHWVYIAITAALPFIVANCFTMSKPDKPIRKITNIEELYSLV